MFIKTLKNTKKLKELKIKYRHAVYIFLSWYKKKLLISGEKMLMSAKLKGRAKWFICFLDIL